MILDLATLQASALCVRIVLDQHVPDDRGQFAYHRHAGNTARGESHNAAKDLVLGQLPYFTVA